MTYKEMFKEIAQKYNLPWALLAEQAYRESGMDASAVGEANDMGLMQIVPSTWDEWAPRVGVSDSFDPYSNVLVGAAYLAFLHQYFADRGYPERYWALVAYSWGPGNLRRHLAAEKPWNALPDSQRRYALQIVLAADLRVLLGPGNAANGHPQSGFERLLARPVYPD